MNETDTPVPTSAAKFQMPQIELPPPNPVTRAQHKREFFWQVTVPFTAFLLLIALLAALLTILQVGTTRTWAEISTIFLIVPVLFITLIVLALLAALIYLVTLLLGTLPPYARLLQNYIELGTSYLKRFADLAAEPVLQVRSWRAMFDFILAWIGLKR